MKSIYLIGSLRNPVVREVAKSLRQWGYDVFDDWHAAGHDADEHWMEYERARGRTYKEALASYAAEHTFSYDLYHLNRCDACVLVTPGGKSAHLELGYMLGQKKPGFILMLEEPERWDVMVKFATEVALTLDELQTFMAFYDKQVGAPCKKGKHEF